MTSFIQITANYINPIFVVADLAPKTTAEKLMQIYEKTDLFPIAGDCSIVHLLQAVSRIVVYSGIALFSLIEDLVNRNLFSDASQSRLRSLAVEIIAASFFDPLSSLEIPSELVAMLRHAEGLMRDDLTLEQNNAMVKATILKTVNGSDPALARRLYSSECPTALPSLRIDSKTLRAVLKECHLYDAPNSQPDEVLGTLLALRSRVMVDRNINYVPRIFGPFLRFTREQLPQVLRNLALCEELMDQAEKLRETSENVENLFDMVTPANVAQFFELLPDENENVGVACYWTDKVTRERSLVAAEVRGSLAALSEQNRSDILLALILGTDLSNRNLQEIKNKICALARVFYQNVGSYNYVNEIERWSARTD